MLLAPSQSFTVGVMCYNEAGTIEKVIEEAKAVLQKITGDFEILVIDDYSTDGTRDILKRIEPAIPELRVHYHEHNKGIGGALRSIYSMATKQFVGVIPGDGQFDISEYLPVVPVPENTFISFWRTENTSYNLFRNALSAVNKSLNQLLLGIALKDVNWTKIYRKSDLDMLDLQLPSSLVESEIAAKLLFLGRQVIEVKSKYLPRTYGKSQGSSWKTIKKAMADLVVLKKVLVKFKKTRGKGK